MRKKIFLLALVTMLLPLFAKAEPVEINGLYYSLNSNNTASVCSEKYWYTYGDDGSGEYRDKNNWYTGDEEVVIPNEISYNQNKYTVTKIDDCAFRWCGKITSVVIPNSITSIGKEAFYGCSKLSSIIIPDGVMYIGGDAFWGTVWDNNLPMGLVYAGSVLYCFKGNRSDINTITIKDGIVSISDRVFENCKNLTSITFPNSLASIGESAFENCSSLTSVQIPNCVKSIYSNAFGNCSSLTSVHITDLDSWCKIWFGSPSSNPLHCAHSLYINGIETKDIIIPDNITYIKSYAFYGFDGLTSVTMPNGVTSIHSSAFNGCRNMTSVSIPNSVTAIEPYAFKGCSGLLSVILPNKIETIYRETFSGCSNLSSVSIPNSVKKIHYKAFYDCKSLNSVQISDISAWCNIDFETRLLYESNNPPADYTSNPLFYAHTLYLNGEELNDMVIPDGTSSIKNYAFYACEGLTSLTIPQCVTEMK